MEDFTHILPGEKPFYKYEKDRKEKCAFLTLNLPEKRNAVPESADEELVAAIDDWENDDNVKSVVAIGNGKHFCGGHDLGGWGGLDMTSDAPRSERRDPQRVQLTRQIVGRPRTLGRLFLSMKPIIAAVRGVCIGMGNMIQVCCDMTIASFSFSTQARMGVVYPHAYPPVSRSRLRPGISSIPAGLFATLFFGRLCFLSSRGHFLSFSKSSSIISLVSLPPALAFFSPHAFASASARANRSGALHS